VSFQAFNLDARLLSAIEKLNYTKPTDIQREAIPVVLEGRDLMASAQTGTGKTAAFMLPTLHKLLTTQAKPGRGPRILVLTPTRELAQQVTDAVRDFGKGSPLKAGAIVGGVSYMQQEKLLAAPLDILVATPGRLMDHMNRGRVDFSRLELFILDEADRMLDMGFIDDIETIIAKLPADRQTLLFSATLEGDVDRIAKQLLKNPARIQIASSKTKHESIEQTILVADDMRHKTALLGGILEDTSVYQAVIFVATKHSADNVADIIKNMGHTASALHGDMRQNVRSRVIEKMHHGKIRVLVATDVAARGLDVKGITHVINFDLPRVSEDYVHRIGRTGRAGATGKAISLVGPQDWMNLTRIERLTGQPITEIKIEGLEPRSSRPLKPQAANHKPSNNSRRRAPSQDRGGYGAANTNHHAKRPHQEGAKKPYQGARSNDDNRGNTQAANTGNANSTFARPAKPRSDYYGKSATGDTRSAPKPRSDYYGKSATGDTRSAPKPRSDYYGKSATGDTRSAPKPRSDYYGKSATGDARPPRAHDGQPARTNTNHTARPPRARAEGYTRSAAPRDQRYVQDKADARQDTPARPKPTIVHKHRRERQTSESAS
jgi:superfamily II DNA/RNA helicase